MIQSKLMLKSLLRSSLIQLGRYENHIDAGRSTAEYTYKEEFEIAVNAPNLVLFSDVIDMY